MAKESDRSSFASGFDIDKKKSGGNGGGSTVVYSVADVPKITYMVVTGT